MFSYVSDVAEFCLSRVPTLSGWLFRLRVTAMVYGCEVDYAVVEPGDLPPEIVLQPRQPGESACDPRGTYMITTGRAPRKMPIVDFGNLPLQRAKVTHVVLYNRTGIATPFRALLAVEFWGNRRAVIQDVREQSQDNQL